MTAVKWVFLFLAFLATFSIASLGIAVAEGSLLIAVLCIAGLLVSFYGARKLRVKQQSNA
ncbi:MULTISPECIES: DUF5325 family protein [Sinobaca]|uniref:DUF5325 family protein n=1 Tax=Sinobaca TaxID=342943 RepID=UPI000E74B396|nr:MULTISPECIES: DUF5325 family protein [Sinobaca]